jgi:xanthine dehydrogenase accessory factor
MGANEMRNTSLKDRIIVIKGAGEMATGVACRLYRANLRRILMLETPAPLAVRRLVSFCESIHDQRMTVEGIKAVRIDSESELFAAWDNGMIAVRVDPKAECISQNKPDVFIDATLAKRNLGTCTTDAPLVIALGPGFVAGKDAHTVVETNRGHDLGRLIITGAAEANTGIPGNIGGYTKERVVRSPADGIFTAEKQIGDSVSKGDLIGRVGSTAVIAPLDGMLRGLIRPDTYVAIGLKIGDVDPRNDVNYCDTVSEKARALGGAVLEAILAHYNR